MKTKVPVMNQNDCFERDSLITATSTIATSMIIKTSNITIY